MTLAAVVRSQLARHGRAMTLRRRVGTSGSFTEADAAGVLRAFSPQELAGGVLQGDARVIIDAQPLLAAPGLAPPQKGDFVVVDGRTWTVQGAHARMDGAAVCAYELWVRGG